MGVQNFEPESQFGLRLKQQISERLSLLNIEDPPYVAEFLLVLIKNNRSPSEIVNEFTGLFGAVIDQKFVQDVINEILMNQGELNPVQQQQQQQQQQQIQQSSQPSQPFSFNLPTQPASMQPSTDNDMMVDGSENKEVRFSDVSQNSFPNNAFNKRSDDNSNRFNFTKNNRNSNNFKSTRGARGGRGGRNLNNNRRHDNMSKMIEMSLDNNNEMTTNFVSDKPKVRCKDFPHCPNKICPNAHPTRICRDFPNCPNQNHTCTYLHPGEDDELFKEYERVKAAKLETKNNRNANTGITLCKFGSVCQKESCPFGHPTPANKDAKVTLLQWCVDNKDCKNPNCTRAHSSPNYKPMSTKSPSPFNNNMMVEHNMDSSSGPVEKTLEQCKFGLYCKNVRCPKRHATSHVLCRDGANCTRIDCSFQHPLAEVCKFGVNCTNPKCAFQHPDGRQISSNGTTATGNKVWINGQNQNTGSTAQRQFAVSDDQVLEQAPPQEV